MSSTLRARAFATTTLALALVAVVPLEARAQELIRSLAFSIKAGPVFSRFSVDNDEGFGYASRVGPAAGISVRLPLGPVSLQPELFHFSKGSVVRRAVGFDNRIVETSIEIRYVEVPLLIQIPITSAGAVTPYVLTGVAFAFETGCVSSSEINGQDMGQDCGFSMVEHVRDRKCFDYSGVFGAGLRIAAGPGAIPLEGRYTYGLRDVDDAIDGSTTRNRSAAVLAGYSFGTGR